MKKIISFVIIYMGVVFIVGYVMSGDIWVGGVLVLVELLCNIVVFYFYGVIFGK